MKIWELLRSNASKTAAREKNPRQLKDYYANSGVLMLSYVTRFIKTQFQIPANVVSLLNKYDGQFS